MSTSSQVSGQVSSQVSAVYSRNYNGLRAEVSADLAAKLAEVSAVSSDLRRMLYFGIGRQVGVEYNGNLGVDPTSLIPTSARSLARFLRYNLAVWQRFIFLRETWPKLAAEVTALVSRNFTWNYADSMRRKVSSGGWDRSGTERLREMKPTSLLPVGVPNLAAAAEAIFTVQVGREIAADLAETWKTYVDYLHNPFGESTVGDRRPLSIERYLTFWTAVDSSRYSAVPPLRTICPAGGREAVSVLRALLNGNRNDSYPTEHELFGLTFCPSQEAIRAVLANLQDRPESKRSVVRRRSPSITAGRELATKRYHDYRRPEENTFSDLANRSHIIAHIDKHTARCGFIGRRYGTLSKSAVKLFRERYRGDEVGAKMLVAMLRQFDLRRGGSAETREYHEKRLREAVGGGAWTIVTGRPAVLAGDDYKVSALWTENGDLVSGYLLLRRNWPDVVHYEIERQETSADFFASLSVGEPRYPAEVSDLAADRIADMQERLTEASSYYFQRLTNEKQTLERKRLSVAKLLRQVRSLPIIDLASSYAVGNCRPGTASFIAQLKLTEVGTSIDGRSLARRWRDSQYPQFDRFAPVVEYCCKQRQQWINDVVWPGLLSPPTSAVSADLADTVSAAETN